MRKIVKKSIKSSQSWFWLKQVILILWSCASIARITRIISEMFVHIKEKRFAWGVKVGRLDSRFETAVHPQTHSFTGCMGRNSLKIREFWFHFQSFQIEILSVFPRLLRLLCLLSVVHIFYVAIHESVGFLWHRSRSVRWIGSVS